jgi:hypothetical protein
MLAVLSRLTQSVAVHESRMVVSAASHLDGNGYSPYTCMHLDPHNLEQTGATGYALVSNNPRMSSGPRLPEKLPSSSLSTASNN